MGRRLRFLVPSGIIGGAAGGRFAGRIDPVLLRWTVVVIGMAVGLILLARQSGISG